MKIKFSCSNCFKEHIAEGEYDGDWNYIKFKEPVECGCGLNKYGLAEEEVYEIIDEGEE